MNCWEILGIEPTQDQDRIRQAYEGQMKFASEQEAKDLERAFREATGEMPPAGNTQSSEHKPAEVQTESSAPSPDYGNQENAEGALSANDAQIVREVVIQVKALLNDDSRLQDAGIWKAILCEPPADQLPLRREIARQLEPQVRPMAENGSFPQPVARFLGDWFDWFSVSEAAQEPDPKRFPEAGASDESQPEEAEDQPPQIVNFWPAVIGWVIGLAILATIFGGMGNG